MALKPFTTLNFPDQQLNRLQDNVAVTFQQILASDIVDGVLLENVAITGGTPLSVNHGLGRVPVMCIPVLQNANTPIWQTSLSATTVVLNSAANVTVNLWVA